MKVLVTGTGGQLGSKLAGLLGRDPRFDVTGTDRRSLDVTDRTRVLEAARALRPAWIVNCTAYNDVERAEEEPDRAFLVNDAAVGHLADAAAACGARLLHVSTDYVFSGEPGGEAGGVPRRPYHEGDAPGPLSAYGRSKLAGEERLRAHGVPWVVLRTSWLYGGPGRNFLHTMLRVADEARRGGRPVRVVSDQIGTPTDAWSLAAQARRVLLEGASGLFHASCEGAASWWDFAGAIFRLAGLGVGVEPIRLEAYPAKARRPRWSVLEKRRLTSLGIHVLPHWTQGLEAAWRLRGLGPA
ncbi:MAG: dTDP-4-dehydrorhamnose reductase [Planctomycetes bacterium]|nr:dTDP-4-dehydrorhamnose reductase [Planctomycetota bacterium]